MLKSAIFKEYRSEYNNFIYFNFGEANANTQLPIAELSVLVLATLVTLVTLVGYASCPGPSSLWPSQPSLLTLATDSRQLSSL